MRCTAPAGRKSVMGVIKFSFPSQHTIFMHDTPDKWMFNSQQRTLSHGCLRLRNPLSVAEILLKEDKGWDADKVQDLARNGPMNNEVAMDKRVRMHIAYFTAWVDEDGKLKTYSTSTATRSADAGALPTASGSRSPRAAIISRPSCRTRRIWRTSRRSRRRVEGSQRTTTSWARSSAGSKTAQSGARHRSAASHAGTRHPRRREPCSGSGRPRLSRHAALARERHRVECRTAAEAVPVSLALLLTSTMLAVTSDVPLAASMTLLLMSCVGGRLLGDGGGDGVRDVRDLAGSSSPRRRWR